MIKYWAMSKHPVIIDKIKQKPNWPHDIKWGQFPWSIATCGSERSVEFCGFSTWLVYADRVTFFIALHCDCIQWAIVQIAIRWHTISLWNMQQLYQHQVGRTRSKPCSVAISPSTSSDDSVWVTVSSKTTRIPICMNTLPYSESDHRAAMIFSLTPAPTRGNQWQLINEPMIMYSSQR